MARFGLATLNHSPLHGLAPEWERHLDAAAAAGFDAIAPDVFWLRAIEAEGVPLARVGRALEERGLGCMELAGLAIGSEERTASELDELLRQTEVLGAERVNTRVVAPLEPAVAERAARCAEALARVGSGLALEFSRGTTLQGIDDARAFLREAGGGPIGVTLDTWHFLLAEGGPDWDALERLPVAELANVQLSDGMPLGERPPFEATMHDRRLPGEGALELDHLARIVARSGFDGAIVLEVLNAGLRAGPLESFAHSCARAARDWWRAAVEARE